MTNTASSCSDDRLQILLLRDEDDVDFRLAAEHVESCENCQSRLAELAAADEDWGEAKSALTLSDVDVSIELEQEERSWSTSGHRRPPKTWTVSMSSQLLSPPSHPEMLGRIGRYEVERLIGAGGMGVVFKAFDSELNRPVAIKVLAPHLAGSGAARQRFSREARAAAAIVQEHVVAIHNVESESEPPFLVMQYVAGESLQSRLDREGPLSVLEVLRIARQTSAGLAAAHEQGLVHRDVKPSNVLLEEGVDRTLLTDFGLARASDDASLTHSGHVPGTPHYMSPEQARGESADQRSDLFSLGSVMYAMCTGRTPFRAETSYGVLRRITDSQPRSIQEVNSEIPLWLGCIIDKLHAKSPGERFESAAELADVLSQCLAHVQQPDTQPLPESVVKLTRSASEGTSFVATLLPRSRFGLLSLAGVAAVFVLLSASVMIARREEKRATPRTSSAVSEEPVASSDFDPDPATHWESAEVEVRQLGQQVRDATTSIERLWGDMPISAQDGSRNLKRSSAEAPLGKESVR
jgi:serine/threonine protein kinase